MPFYDAKSELLPLGLIGPVVIKAKRVINVLLKLIHAVLGSTESRHFPSALTGYSFVSLRR
jgi:hypothetical protein